MNKIKNFFKNRFVFFFLFLAIFFIIQLISKKPIFPSAEANDLWFYSGLFMVIFSILFIEPYYSSPKNVITNVIPLILVLISVKSSFSSMPIWWIFFSSLSFLVMLSIISIMIYDKNKSGNFPQNKISNQIKNIATRIGKAKVVYSAVFLYFLLDNYSLYSFHTVALIAIWCLILLIDPKELTNSFVVNKEDSGKAIGEIIRVYSKNVFLAKVFTDCNYIERFAIVKFRHLIQADTTKLSIGIIIDTYSLNNEKWIKILALSTIDSTDAPLEGNYVVRIPDKKMVDAEIKTKINNLVGIVTADSVIEKIKFEYAKQNENLEEGNLVELTINDERIFYQIVQGYTFEENIEEENRNGFIKGEAVQLGKWDEESNSFEKYGWVPKINTPVFLADTSNITIPEIQYPLYDLGKIPNTSLPVILKLNETISHHLAILGVTGTGKSFIARDIIKQISADTKIICVDFNNEFAQNIQPPPSKIISDEIANEIQRSIDDLTTEMDKFPNNRNHEKIDGDISSITSRFETSIEAFIKSDDPNIRVFELPDVSNSSGIFEYTKYFFKSIFNIAKKYQQGNNTKKICIVLEEAHTIIPEWNFSGNSDRNSQSATNSIAQIALQGRKYGVGFIVIAQRTANVSKTVLTQCNTIICFQAFDDTSTNFLSNYFGKDVLKALPNLQKYHAIVSGKGLMSNIPLVVDLTRKSENE